MMFAWSVVVLKSLYQPFEWLTFLQEVLVACMLGQVNASMHAGEGNCKLSRMPDCIEDGLLSSDIQTRIMDSILFPGLLQCLCARFLLAARSDSSLNVRPSSPSYTDSQMPTRAPRL